MNKIPTYNWKGYSGKIYTYFTYRLPVDFDPNQPGNYIFSRQNTQGNWLPIYIGQGDLNDRVNYHNQIECIRKRVLLISIVIQIRLKMIGWKRNLIYLITTHNPINQPDVMNYLAVKLD